MKQIHPSYSVFTLFLLFTLLPFYGCSADSTTNKEASGSTDSQPVEATYKAPQDLNYEALDTATFAGGCFWCTETVFERVQGVKEVVSGYAGGSEANPTYKQVSAGMTSHAEAVQVYYDPEVVSFNTLAEVFFKGAHDPTQLNRQGPDVGEQYRSVAFYSTPQEKQIIEEMIAKLEKEGYYDARIVTQVEPLGRFWIAEDYHQDYYVNNPDNSYIQSVSRPKVEKFKEKFKDILKEDYPQ
ncbi:peptide-methionine (S)-S-oxide reductase MsrA [Roseivirga sp. BDSF3-8]|uniref:peptide-methionine (S)-S-oxide reductase MsrA n=1 Tax=Roseivirga sp. BDSF3-8 TaxID=3241598 RepID=UPI003532609E